MEDKIMLVLSRKVDESINIDGRIKIKIVKLKGNRVTIGIEAPDDVSILRGELGDWSELPCDEYLPHDSQIMPQLVLP
jgi:carbon storage regulator CsrA